MKKLFSPISNLIMQITIFFRVCCNVEDEILFFSYNLHNLFLIFCLHKTYVNTEEEDNEINNNKKKLCLLKDHNL